MMDRHFFHQVLSRYIYIYKSIFYISLISPLSLLSLQFKAAKRHEFVEVTMWGYEFEGYDATLSLKQNIIQRYGRV